MQKTLLSVQHLSLHIGTPNHYITPVKNVSFDIFPGETLCLLGESGSGKSLTALSILQLLPAHCFHDKESKIFFEDQNLLTLSEYQLQRIRGKEIAMIFQEPMTSLNPVFKIKDQIKEVIQLQNSIKNQSLKSLKNPSLKRNAIYDEIDRLLNAVQITDINRVKESYPHEISGGMRQRVMIAMCLAGNPKLLIADEPTTALDVITQMQILELLKKIQKDFNMSILFITHDLKVAKIISKRMLIMQHGNLIEQGESQSIFQHPKDPYTQHLFSISPKQQKPTLQENNQILLSVKNLNIHFPVKEGFFKRTKHIIKAVDDVSFDVFEGETLGLVGASGSGKTSLAKALLFLIPANSGNIVFMNQDLTHLSKNQLRKKRSDFQMIFQDPFSSLDPRMRIVDVLEEGMIALNIGSNHSERLDRIDELLKQVDLNPEYKFRYPHQFSGGERQRICIARALSVSPRLIVCDEPTSSLDASVAAEVIDLLINLQTEFDLSYLFITHNFSIIKSMAHRIMVMYQGKIVEMGNTNDVLSAPHHEYTEKLLKNSL